MATKSDVPLSSRISASFTDLADAAARLNAASDELAKTITPIDNALKKLNLGVAAWHTYSSFEDGFGDYSNRRLGYARVGRKWGLALSATAGNFNHEEEDHEEWLFNEAPRWMRLEAVDHIPALLDVLVNEVQKVTSDLHLKSRRAHELAKTISLPPAKAEVKK